MSQTVTDTGVVLGKTKIPSRALELLQWTMHAQGTDQTRYFLCGISIEQGDSDDGRILVATDGRRLHTATVMCAEFPIGLWHVEITKASVSFSGIDGVFPNWRRVIPEHTVKVCEYIAYPWKKGDAGTVSWRRDSGSTSLAIGTLLHATGATFNLQYLFDLASDQKIPIQFAVGMSAYPPATDVIAERLAPAEDPRRHSVAFQADDRKAVLMPMGQ